MFACFVCKEKLLYIGFIQWPIWQVNQKELLIGGFMSRVGTVGEWRETLMLEWKSTTASSSYIN
jgi:uncharacterized CHY-type Zn-finger protein